ncbi:hypothetical protein RF11_08209 [Thelohanellus kitauei]|uniref:Uncharacterized protein n=1 Tax=Thelohanellus kitauei TaxID=669202 RepID=A0A0C2JWK5_THEKT|nr:hypothetical protein RF11_08209 [Thelohanellus kitauei]
MDTVALSNGSIDSLESHIRQHPLLYEISVEWAKNAFTSRTWRCYMKSALSQTQNSAGELMKNEEADVKYIHPQKTETRKRLPMDKDNESENADLDVKTWHVSVLVLVALFFIASVVLSIMIWNRPKLFGFEVILIRKFRSGIQRSPSNV